MSSQTKQTSPWVTFRRIIRLLRDEKSPSEDPCRATLRDCIEIAVFRLPARQREVVQRHDLGGESARQVQRALHISARQFFRDRRAAVTTLSMQVPYLAALQPTAPVEFAASVHEVTNVPDATMSQRVYARSLAHAGSTQCLRVLDEIARSTKDPAVRTDVLLELTELALDFDEYETARNAIDLATQTLNNSGELPYELSEYLAGRLARANARITEPCPDASVKLNDAVARLRGSLAASPNFIDAHVALSDALGDLARLDFEVGNFATARAASAEAVHIIGSVALWTRPRALEIMAMDAVIDACLSGRLSPARATVFSLLRRSVDSGWSATASRLGADLVGLYAVGGEYDVALLWYDQMWQVALKGARPSDRWSLTVELAGSYAAAGRPQDALAALIRAERRAGCPARSVPARHAFAASALIQLGKHVEALREARDAMRGYAARSAGSGLGDAHRLMAKSHAGLGNVAAACEHITEARRLGERYGMPESLLCTIRAQAQILQRPALKADALELERLLRARAGT